MSAGRWEVVAGYGTGRLRWCWDNHERSVSEVVACKPSDANFHAIYDGYAALVDAVRAEATLTEARRLAEQLGVSKPEDWRPILLDLLNLITAPDGPPWMIDEDAIAWLTPDPKAQALAAGLRASPLVWTIAEIQRWNELRDLLAPDPEPTP